MIRTGDVTGWSAPTHTLPTTRQPAREPIPCPALELLNTSAGHPCFPVTVLGTPSNWVPRQGGVGEGVRPAPGCEHSGNIVHLHPR